MNDVEVSARKLADCASRPVGPKCPVTADPSTAVSLALMEVSSIQLASDNVSTEERARLALLTKEATRKVCGHCSPPPRDMPIRARAARARWPQSAHDNVNNLRVLLAAKLADRASLLQLMERHVSADRGTTVSLAVATILSSVPANYVSASESRERMTLLAIVATAVVREPGYFAHQITCARAVG